MPGSEGGRRRVRTSSSPAAGPRTATSALPWPRATVTPDAINEQNAHESARALLSELDQEAVDAAATSAARPADSSSNVQPCRH